jgi:hypothetical protein
LLALSARQNNKKPRFKTRATKKTHTQQTTQKNTTNNQDGGNTNNLVTVLPREAGAMAQRERLLSPDGALTEPEREELGVMVCPWASHDLDLHLPAAA